MMNFGYVTSLEYNLRVITFSNFWYQLLLLKINFILSLSKNLEKNKLKSIK